MFFQQSELIGKIFRFVIRVVIRIQGDIKLFEVDILVENDQSPNGVGNGLLHLSGLSFNDEVIKGFLISVGNFSVFR